WLLVVLTLTLAACSKQNNDAAPPPKRVAIKKTMAGKDDVPFKKPHSTKLGDANGEIFADGYVARLQIEIPRAGLATLRRYHWGNGERVAVPCTVREGATLYTNVAVHLKGAAGSFQSVDDRPCLTLNF